MTAPLQSHPQTSSLSSGQLQPSPLSPALSLEAETAVEAVITAKQAISDWQEELTRRLAVLDNMVQAGTIPEKVSHQGYLCYITPGRTTYTYPPSVKTIEQQLKQEKELAVATGLATPKQGQPFWTIREITAS